MKQYVIDELRLEDYKKIRQHLNGQFGSSEVEGIYWIPVALEYLTKEQIEHEDCRPYYFAMILEENMLTCELLIRTLSRVRCSCMGYADENQRNWIINYADRLLNTLKIII